MLDVERRQIRTDFGFTPTLVDEYVNDTPRKDALRAARQVTGAGTYLSWMVTGEPNFIENAVYAVTIVCLDEVTDERGESLSDGTTTNALHGENDHPSLEILDVARSLAKGHRFEEAIQQVAYWQDQSLGQERDISPERVRKVTRRKGGWSALGHLHMMTSDTDRDTDEFASRFGYVMQLLDDYLDQPEDEAEGVTTELTCGEKNAGDVARHVDDMLDDAEMRWGNSKAVSRFRKVTSLHLTMGDVANRTPANPSWFVPWYL
jgi:hypothetical protein